MVSNLEFDYSGVVSNFFIESVALH